MTATDIAEVLSLGAANKVSAPGALLGGAYKTARKALEPEQEPPFRVVGERTGIAGSDFGLTSELVLPTAYADAVQLNLTPFISNVGAYLQHRGVIPDSDLLALGLDLALDFGNLLPFAGQITSATKAASRARLISRALEGGAKGRKGKDLVDGLIGMVEAAGKVGRVGNEVLDAAKAGDKAAMDRLLKSALKFGEPTDDAMAVVKALRQDRKALIGLLENLDAIGKVDDLPGAFFLQPTRVQQLAAGQRTSRLAAIPPNRLWRDPAAFARQAFLGITYEGERFLMPAANAVAGVMDKLAPLKNVPVLVDGLRVSSSPAGDVVKLAEAAERIPGGINFFQRERMLNRAWLLVALPNEEQLAGLGEGLTEGVVRDMLRKATGRKEVSPEQVARATEGILAKVKEGAAVRDAAILQMRDEAVEAATGRATEAWQAVGMLDSALAQADLADLRNWHATFSDDWIVQDPQGVGMALMGRAAAGDRVFAALSQADTEIIRGILPRKLDQDAVLEAGQYVVSHPDLFELREGRAVLTASMDTIREQSPMFADLLLEKGYPGFEEALRTTGLHPEITGLLGGYRDVLSRAKDTLAHEGVLTGFLADYFPRTGTFTKEGLKALGIDARHAARFMDVAVERHAAGSTDAVVEIIFGKPNAQGVRPLTELMNQAAAGKLTLQETRRFSEKMLKRMVDAGWYKPGRDGVAALTQYLASAHKALLANKMWRDLPELPTKVGRPELEALIGKAKAALVTNDQLAELRRFYKSIDEVPGWARPLGLFDEATGNTRTFVTGRALTREITQAELRKLTASSLRDARQRAEARAVDELFAAEKVGSVKTPALEEDWIRTGHVPGSVPRAAEIGKAIRNAKDRIFREEAGSIAAASARPKKAPATGATKRPTMLVFKGDAGHIQEAFGLWQKGDFNHLSDLYDRINGAVKSVVLLGDLFYFNALATISVATDPKAVARILMDEAGQLRRAPKEIPAALGRAALAPITGARASNAAAQAVVGAAAGLAAAPAFDADEPQQAAGFALAGALYGAMLGTALRRGRDARKIAFNPMNVDSLFWAGQGGWRGRPDDRAIGVATSFLRDLEERMIRRSAGATPPLAGILRATRHAVEDYEQTLFGVIHNGGVQAAFEQAFRPALAKLQAEPGWAKLTEQQRFYRTKKIATEAMQFANGAFASNRYSLLFQSPHAEKILSRAFIAPQWLTSRLNLAASMLGNMGPVKGALVGSAVGSLIELADAGFDPDELSRGPIFGAAAGAAGAWWSRNIIRRMGVQGDLYRNMALRLSGTALVAGWATYNLLNYAFTGHWMHENEEGRKLAVQLPNGQYYDPGKPFVEAYEWAGVLDKQTFEAPVFSRAASKLAPLPNAMRIVLNRNYWGGAIIEAEDGPSVIGAKWGEVVFSSVAPIGLRSTGEALAQGVYGTGIDFGGLNRSLAGIAGLPIKGKATGMVPGASLSPLTQRVTLGPPPLTTTPSLLELGIR